MTNETDGNLSRIDPKTGRVAHRIGVGTSPGPVQVGSGAVWVANTLDGTVSRIDPSTNVVVATVTVGEGPAALAVGAEGVLVANELGGSVMRIDPRTNVVVETIETGQRPAGLLLDDRRLWVSARDASVTHRGGTLRVAVSAIDAIDQYGHSDVWQANLTGDGLTAYRRVTGTDGAAALVPDVAVSIPAPTDGGRTNTFQLRRGVSYSTGETVGPEDIRRAIERVYRLGPAGTHYDAIVFLLSRIREHYLAGADNDAAVVRGLASTARVITSAALIMVAVFLGFVAGNDPTTKMFGLGLATAIFVDATIIRLVLVPAAMKLMGDANWWLPRRLDRALPGGHRPRPTHEIGDPAGAGQTP